MTHRIGPGHASHVAIMLGWLLAYNVVLQLAGVTRTIQIWDPVILTQILNPLTILLLVLVPGDKSFLLPRGPMQALLLASVAFAAAVGLVGMLLGQAFSLRYALSALFNGAAAYVVYSLGRALPSPIAGAPPFRLIAWAALVAAFVSITAVIVFDRLGFVQRFSADAYNQLLPFAYFLPGTMLAALATLLPIILSNKRGAILMVIAVGALFVAARLGTTRIDPKRAIPLALAALAAGVVVLAVAAPHLQNTLWPRVVGFLQASSLAELDVVSGGRLAELRAAFADLSPIQFLLGGGAGYFYAWEYGTEVILQHNVHFSPATLALRYGVPFAVVFYGVVGWVLLRGLIEARLARWDRARLFPLLYVGGAAAYSLTAFSIHIDLFF
ncbi:hypothetical protein VB712_10795, partial [Spirulina sp. CCNP1310]